MGNPVEVFEIPEHLAKELSDLLVRESIRKKLLSEVLNDPVKYEQIEDLLAKATERIDEIKNLITVEFVPDEFQSEKFIWDYKGYSIDKNVVSIYKI